MACVIRPPAPAAAHHAGMAYHLITERDAAGRLTWYITTAPTHTAQDITDLGDYPTAGAAVAAAMDAGARWYGDTEHAERVESARETAAAWELEEADHGGGTFYAAYPKPA